MERAHQVAFDVLKRMGELADGGQITAVVGSIIHGDERMMDFAEKIAALIEEYAAQKGCSPTGLIMSAATALGYLIGDAVDTRYSFAGLACEEVTETACKIIRAVAEEAFKIQAKEKADGTAND